MFKTVSYYVQQMYATNKGTHVLSLTTPAKTMVSTNRPKKGKPQPVANQEGQNGLFASAAFDKDAGEVIVKVVNTSKEVQAITLNLKDLSGAVTAQTLTLNHQGMDDENSIQRPELIIPKKGSVSVEAGKKLSVIKDQLPAMSFRIYRIKK
jgi:alpha-L-arabinofuranosidase